MSRLALLALFALPLLSGCVKVDGVLTTGADTPLILSDRGTAVTIPQGDQRVQLSVAEHSKDESELYFRSLKRGFRFHLPDAKVLLNLTEPLRLSAESVGQPVGLLIVRETDLKKDKYTIAFVDSKTQGFVASGVFKYKSGEPAFDHKSREFLASFQKVEHSQRGTVIPINSRVSPIVDHLAQVYIAPWIYARYAHVQWVFSHRYGQYQKRRAQWKKVIDSSPVVDLFLFNHEGDDISGLDESADLGWKKHQLRLLYTEGCDSASSSYFQRFMSQYNAAVAIGHRRTSASPFVAFPLVRFWTYGASALNATRWGWGFGHFEGGLIDYLSFTAISHSLWRSHDEMLYETEPGLEWTSEMPPEKLFIDQSAVLKRDTHERRTWTVAFIDHLKTDFRTGELDSSRSLFEAATPAQFYP